jgi:hypothetical protein
MFDFLRGGQVGDLPHFLKKSGQGAVVAGEFAGVPLGDQEMEERFRRLLKSGEGLDESRQRLDAVGTDGDVGAGQFVAYVLGHGGAWSEEGGGGIGEKHI